MGRLVSEGRRGEFKGFGWQPEDVPDPQENETFLRSKLNWDELDQPPHAEILAWYRHLIALRRRCPSLTNGRLEEVFVDLDREAGWLLLVRGAVTLVCNLGDQAQEVPLILTETTHVGEFSQAGDPPRFRVELASQPDAHLTERGVYLLPQSVVILLH